MDVVLFLMLVVGPCAVCAWLWWRSRGNGSKQTTYTSAYKARYSTPPARSVVKMTGETTHPDYDGSEGQNACKAEEFAKIDRVLRPPRERKTSPCVMREGDVALAFCVGNRYYDAKKNRVFECIALRGKKARSAAFGGLDSVEDDKEYLTGIDREMFSWMWKKVRTDGGVETCQRGALRADRQATEEEISEEKVFLSELREREKNYKPDGSFKIEVSYG